MASVASGRLRLGPAVPARPVPRPSVTPRPVPHTTARAITSRRGRFADPAFRITTLVFALSVVAIALVIATILFAKARPALAAFGWDFLWGSSWDPVLLEFGALPFIYGTLATTTLALLLAVPVGLGAAVCLSELLPRRVADPLTFLIELLVAVPSVVYGLVGVFVLVPAMRSIGGPIADTLGFIPFLKGPVYGIGLLTASVVLAIMIVPYIIAVSREVLLAVPRTQREGALALGATRWETIRHVVVPYARTGILGSVFLALARALGETLAVTMVIGNRPQISSSLFAPAYTMAAVLANEFTEATSDLYVSALVEVGLVLFGITLIVNGVARLLIMRVKSEVARA